MNSIISLGNTHEGRDKFCKALQYMLKVVISSSTSKDLIERLTPSFSKNNIFYY